jgi:hypothetical protein
MKINFSKKQFKQLLDLVYLGEWTANSSKLMDERNVAYDELFQYVCSFAKDFGFDDTITYDNELNGYYPTLDFEEQLQPLITNNDNEVLWSELSGRLAKRDLVEMEETFQTKDAYFKKMFEIVERYETEFEKNGLTNLVIKENQS